MVSNSWYFALATIYGLVDLSMRPFPKALGLTEAGLALAFAVLIAIDGHHQLSDMRAFRKTSALAHLRAERRRSA